MICFHPRAAWGVIPAALAPFFPAILLHSQDVLPAFPSPSTQDAPQSGELVALRPFSLPEKLGAERQFRYRGEQITQEQGSWTLIHGAVESDQFLLLADRITYNTVQGVLEAEGHIRLEGPDIRMRCERLKMDWNTRSGEAWALSLEMPPSWHLKSKHVTFLDSLRYWNFDEVEATPCPDERRGWSAKLSNLNLEIEGFARFKHARIMVGGVPVLYFPWAMYPAKQKRSSGLLFPEIGYSNRDGLTLKQGYYQVLGESADATFSPKFFSKRGVLFGGELRWHPELTHSGSLSGSFIRPRSREFLPGELPRNRYRFNFRELWQREDGWQFTADVNQASDALLEADFGSSIGALGGNVYNSALFAGKSFSWGAFSLSAGETRTFFSKDDPFYKEGFPTSMLRQSLPSAQVRLFAIPLGPLYIDGGVNASRFAYKLDLGESANFKSRYPWTRGDTFLRLHGRLGQWGPFRSDLQIAGRFTYYSASLKNSVFSVEKKKDSPDPVSNPGLDPFRVEGQPLFRWLASSRLQLSGPQLGRRYEKLKLFGYQGDLNHTLDPFIAFTANTQFRDSAVIPRFDETDSRPGVGGSAEGERSIEIGLKQHILGRKGKGDIFADLVRWRISARFHMKPILLSDGRTKNGWASLDNDIDIEPDERLRLSFRRSSDVASSDADNSFSAEYTSKTGSKFGLALFSTGINRFLVRQRGIQLGGIQRFRNDSWRFEYQASYDFRQSHFTFAQGALAYVTPCLATRLRYCHVLQPAGSKTGDNTIELGFTLKELGNLFSPSHSF